MKQPLVAVLINQPLSICINLQHRGQWASLHAVRALAVWVSSSSWPGLYASSNEMLADLDSRQVIKPGYRPQHTGQQEDPEKR